MPEGPEVRKYADALDAVLAGRVITSLEARTREARAWLQDNAARLRGRRVNRVFSHGKHLIGLIEGGCFFHSHLMMWGRWQIFVPEAPVEKDRRERARIVVEGGAAVLFSAPIFNVGEGDPYRLIENLASLGPDVIPYDGDFDEVEFRRRLLLPEHHEITIGAALLNQRILAGLGNYLRAEVLFSCRLNPWRKVKALTKKDLQCLTKTAPALARRAYEHSATASDAERDRMRNNTALVYQPGREYGTRHLVFRRTNLPCLNCGEPIKQLRQQTYNAELTNSEADGPGEPEERTRIVYFCAKCQKVKTAAPKDLKATAKL
ncbi:MAG TPA: DNA-formamidopyrimidine glycosylase family protein [Pyrinomonadaceae bacterium]|jgi:formamidopyrimidine-DNA glycosylase|nr:DNA-formamidopyrimidine glycosylase family protein [Pyrinomonadaceae bacterium]